MENLLQASQDREGRCRKRTQCFSSGILVRNIQHKTLYMQFQFHFLLTQSNMCKHFKTIYVWFGREPMWLFYLSKMYEMFSSVDLLKNVFSGAVILKDKIIESTPVAENDSFTWKHLWNLADTDSSFSAHTWSEEKWIAFTFTTCTNVHNCTHLYWFSCYQCPSGWEKYFYGPLAKWKRG